MEKEIINIDITDNKEELEIERDLLLRHDVLLSLMPLFHTNIQTENQQTFTLLRNATWTISDFCRGKPSADLLGAK